jgi:hypothetical protein
LTKNRDYAHIPIPDERFDLNQIESSRNLSVKAFHAKAGRSQVDSAVASWKKVLFSRRVAASALQSPPTGDVGGLLPLSVRRQHETLQGIVFPRRGVRVLFGKVIFLL